MESIVFSKMKVIWNELDLIPFDKLPLTSEKIKHILKLFLSEKCNVFIFNDIKSNFEWTKYSESQVDYSNGKEIWLSYKKNTQLYDLKMVLTIQSNIRKIISSTPTPDISDFKMSYEYWYNVKDNDEIKVLVQAVHFSEKMFAFSSTGLRIVCDLSFLKIDGFSNFCIISFTKCDLQSDFETPKKIATPFSNREKEVVSHILAGFSSKEIASKLFISVETVRNHRKNILLKSDCNSSVQLFKKCFDLGWNALL